MRTETINKLCCPFDRADLQLTIITKDLNEQVIEGFLVCKECSRIYPVVQGIPIMSPDEYRDFKLEQPLMVKWQNQLKEKSVENFRIVEQERKKIV